jgi:hypothetical protein
MPLQPIGLLKPTARVKTFPRAAYFNGVNAYVYIPASSYVNPSGDFTVVTWVALLSMPNSWYGVVDAGRNYVANFWILTMKGVLGLLFGIGFTDGTISEIYYPNVGVGDWHMYTGVVSVNTMVAYLDTAWKSSLTFTKTRNVKSLPLTIGSRNTVSDFSNVYVSAVYIYNRALSDQEIQQIYNNPLNPPSDGLVLWFDWTSLDCNAGIWYDKSGYGNNGTLYNVQCVDLIRKPVAILKPVA